MTRNSTQDARETRRSAIILSLSAIAAAGTVAAMPLLRKPARDAKSACLAGPLARKTIILIDRTDPWSTSTAGLLTATLKRIAHQAADEDRLQVVPFDGSAAALAVPIFDKCKPPSSGNMLIETPQRIAKVHTDHFAAPLIAALDQLARPSSAPRTELVQTIGMLAARSQLDAPATVTTLHIFSDMEENSTAFSFTRRPAQNLELFAAHFAAAIGERLKHIALQIHVTPPAGQALRPDPRIERAWKTALARHGITFTWEPL